MTVALPNIRRLYCPDPGHVICDTDLDRADLQVVVWESDDTDLKRRLRDGVDIHITNGLDIMNIPSPPEDELIISHPNYPEHLARFKKQRTFAKAFCHGTNYGGKPPTMAKVAGITIREAEAAQDRWFSAHPGIKNWHTRIEDSLISSRSVRNRFGFRRFYFDRIDSILPEALAWIPQSTVAIVTNLAWQRLDALPWVDVLLQVHDSLVWQLPHQLVLQKKLPEVRDLFAVEIPYDDPLIIPVGLKTSSKSWGDCKETDWESTRSVLW